MGSKKKSKANKKSLFQKIRNKYRISIMSEDSFEEKVTTRLTLLNLFVVVSGIVMLMILLTVYIVAFTSLRTYIPGYADVETKQQVVFLLEKTKSLEKKLKRNNTFLKHMQAGILGKTITEEEIKKNLDSFSTSQNIKYNRSEADSMLRLKVERASQYNFNPNLIDKDKNILDLLFFPPVTGTITDSFNFKNEHLGIDIVTKKNEAVKATLSGTVVLSTWTATTGHTIAIQHSDNIISVYKHNSILLKKQGAPVTAGQAIAIVGNSGEFSSGPHLHFELWHNGAAINPLKFVTF